MWESIYVRLGLEYQNLDVGDLIEVDGKMYSIKSMLFTAGDNFVEVWAEEYKSGYLIELDSEENFDVV